jgi:hypothetical protein
MAETGKWNVGRPAFENTTRVLPTVRMIDTMHMLCTMRMLNTDKKCLI